LAVDGFIPDLAANSAINSATAALSLSKLMDDAGYRRGLELFNKGEFFDAHEVLEDVWRAAPEVEKKFLQGLIQVAVGLHHHSRGNLVGARSLLARAHGNLGAYPAQHGGIDLAGLRTQLERWVGALEHGGSVPPLPRIEADAAEQRSH
jgi:predicted metal-dependent hydrolase